MIELPWRNKKIENKEIINKMRQKVNSLLGAFSYTNDYVEGRNKVLYEVLDYLDELENDIENQK